MNFGHLKKGVFFTPGKPHLFSAKAFAKACHVGGVMIPFTTIVGAPPCSWCIYLAVNSSQESGAAVDHVKLIPFLEETKSLGTYPKTM